uniref:Odorant receptor n=1 Tax=Eogystia hippophaecolus TaxID=1206364 RepID=A0A1B3P5Q9_EOGHI|nr:odorant receptor [Eogystia hippophaecolus]
MSAVTTCTLWAIMPLFDNTGTRSFPFKIWMPVKPQGSPEYEFGYVYQIVTIYISAFLFFSIDSVTLSMIMFGSAQLEIIMDKVKKLQVVPMSAKLKLVERDARIKSNNELFTECIRQHQAVIKFIQTVEDTYHANIFFQLSGSVAIICIIGLRISIEERNSVRFFSMVNYMVTMLSQLFLYCWCGNELTIRSQELREVMYQSPWYEQDIKFKRALWIAMERMKRPIIFKAGRYIPLSRPTFVSILRSSYSYFAVLNQTNKK